MLLLVYIVVAIFICLLFTFLLRKGYFRAALALLLVLLAFGLVQGILLQYGIGAGIFGRVFSCLFLPLAILCGIILLVESIPFLRAFKDDARRQVWFVVGVLLIPLLVLAPVATEFVLWQTCDAINRVRANTIVQALNPYRSRQGNFPMEVGELVPEDLAAIPRPVCFSPYYWFHDEHFLGEKDQFDLEQCREGPTLITVSSLETDFILRLNLETGRWARVSFLDGVCSHLDR